MFTTRPLDKLFPMRVSPPPAEATARRDPLLDEVRAKTRRDKIPSRPTTANPRRYSVRPSILLPIRVIWDSFPLFSKPFLEYKSPAYYKKYLRHKHLIPLNTLDKQWKFDIIITSPWYKQVTLLQQACHYIWLEHNQQNVRVQRARNGDINQLD